MDTPVDLEAVERITAKLERVLEEYPELQEHNPERQQALEAWLAWSEEGKSMAYKPTGNPVGRPKTKEYVTLLARVPADLAALVKKYANQHRISVATVLREGAEWRIGEGDPRGTGLYLDEPVGIREQVYHSNTGNNTAAPQEGEALQEVRDLLARQWEQIQALAQALERQSVLDSDGVYSSNTGIRLRQQGHITEQASAHNTAKGKPMPPGAAAGAEAETAQNGNTVIQSAEGKPRGRKPVLRPGILALLDEHPEGLTAAELKVYLRTEKHIGDTLAGMTRDGLLVKQGKGQGLRYQLATT